MAEYGSLERLMVAVLVGDLPRAQATIEEMRACGWSASVMRARKEAFPEHYRTGAQDPNPLALPREGAIPGQSTLNDFVRKEPPSWRRGAGRKRVPA